MSKDTRYLNLTELEHFSKEISDKLQGRLEYKTTLSLRPAGATERTDWNDIINLNNPSLVGDCYLLQGTGVGDFVEVNGVKYFHGEYIICTNVVDKDDTGTLSADVEIMKFGGSTADIDNKTILDHNDDGTYAQLHTRVGGWLEDTTKYKDLGTTTVTTEGKAFDTTMYVDAGGGSKWQVGVSTFEFNLTLADGTKVIETLDCVSTGRMENATSGSYVTYDGMNTIYCVKNSNLHVGDVVTLVAGAKEEVNEKIHHIDTNYINADNKTVLKVSGSNDDTAHLETEIGGYRNTNFVDTTFGNGSVSFNTTEKRFEFNVSIHGITIKNHVGIDRVKDGLTYKINITDTTYPTPKIFETFILRQINTVITNADVGLFSADLEVVGNDAIKSTLHIEQKQDSPLYLVTSGYLYPVKYKDSYPSYMRMEWFIDNNNSISYIDSDFINVDDKTIHRKELHNGKTSVLETEIGGYKEIENTPFKTAQSYDASSTYFYDFRCDIEVNTLEASYPSSNFIFNDLEKDVVLEFSIPLTTGEINVVRFIYDEELTISKADGKKYLRPLGKFTSGYLYVSTNYYSEPSVETFGSSYLTYVDKSFIVGTGSSTEKPTIKLYKNTIHYANTDYINVDNKTILRINNTEEFDHLETQIGGWKEPGEITTIDYSGSRDLTFKETTAYARIINMNRINCSDNVDLIDGKTTITFDCPIYGKTKHNIVSFVYDKAKTEELSDGDKYFKYMAPMTDGYLRLHKQTWDGANCEVYYSYPSGWSWIFPTGAYEVGYVSSSENVTIKFSVDEIHHIDSKYINLDNNTLIFNKTSNVVSANIDNQTIVSVDESLNDSVIRTQIGGHKTFNTTVLNECTAYGGGYEFATYGGRFAGAIYDTTSFFDKIEDNSVVEFTFNMQAGGQNVIRFIYDRDLTKGKASNIKMLKAMNPAFDGSIQLTYYPTYDPPVINFSTIPSSMRYPIEVPMGTFVAGNVSGHPTIKLYKYDISHIDSDYINVDDKTIRRIMDSTDDVPHLETEIGGWKENKTNTVVEITDITVEEETSISKWIAYGSKSDIVSSKPIHLNKKGDTLEMQFVDITNPDKTFSKTIICVNDGTNYLTFTDNGTTTDCLYHFYISFSDSSYYTTCYGIIPDDCKDDQFKVILTEEYEIIHPVDINYIPIDNKSIIAEEDPEKEYVLRAAIEGGSGQYVDWKKIADNTSLPLNQNFTHIPFNAENLEIYRYFIPNIIDSQQVKFSITAKFNGTVQTINFENPIYDTRDSSYSYNITGYKYFKTESGVEGYVNFNVSYLYGYLRFQISHSEYDTTYDGNKVTFEIRYRETNTIRTDYLDLGNGLKNIGGKLTADIGGVNYDDEGKLEFDGSNSLCTNKSKYNGTQYRYFFNNIYYHSSETRYLLVGIYNPVTSDYYRYEFERDETVIKDYNGWYAFKCTNYNNISAKWYWGSDDFVIFAYFDMGDKDNLYCTIHSRAYTFDKVDNTKCINYDNATLKLDSNNALKTAIGGSIVDKYTDICGGLTSGINISLDADGIIMDCGNRSVNWNNLKRSDSYIYITEQTYINSSINGQNYIAGGKYTYTVSGSDDNVRNYIKSNNNERIQFTKVSDTVSSIKIYTKDYVRQDDTETITAYLLSNIRLHYTVTSKVDNNYINIDEQSIVINNNTSKLSTAVGGYLTETEKVMVSKTKWGNIWNSYYNGKYHWVGDNLTYIYPLHNRSDEDWYIKFTLIGSDDSIICQDIELKYYPATGIFGTLNSDAFAYYEYKYTYHSNLTIVYQTSYTVPVAYATFKIYSKYTHNVSDSRYIPTDNITTFIAGSDSKLKVRHDYTLVDDARTGLKTAIGGKAIGTWSGNISNGTSSATLRKTSSICCFDMDRVSDKLTTDVDDIYDVLSSGKFYYTRVYFKYVDKNDVEHIVDFTKEVNGTNGLSRNRSAGAWTLIGTAEGHTWYVVLEHHARRFYIQANDTGDDTWDDTHNTITNVNVTYRVDNFNYKIPSGVVPIDDVTVKESSGKLVTTVGGGLTTNRRTIWSKDFGETKQIVQDSQNYKLYIYKNCGFKYSQLTNNNTYYCDVLVTYSDGTTRSNTGLVYKLNSGNIGSKQFVASGYTISIFEDQTIIFASSGYSALDATSIHFEIYTKEDLSYSSPKFTKTNNSLICTTDLSTLTVNHDTSLVTDTSLGLKTVTGEKYFSANKVQVLNYITGATQLVNGSVSEYYYIRWSGDPYWNSEFAEYISINNGAFKIVYGESGSEVTENYTYTKATYDGTYNSWGYKYKLDIQDSRGKSFWWVYPKGKGTNWVMFITDQTAIDGYSINITHLAPWASWILPETFVKSNSKFVNIDNKTLILDSTNNNAITTAIGGYIDSNKPERKITLIEWSGSQGSNRYFYNLAGMWWGRFTDQNIIINDPALLRDSYISGYFKRACNWGGSGCNFTFDKAYYSPERSNDDYAVFVATSENISRKPRPDFTFEILINKKTGDNYAGWTNLGGLLYGYSAACSFYLHTFDNAVPINGKFVPTDNVTIKNDSVGNNGLRTVIGGGYGFVSDCYEIIYMNYVSHTAEEAIFTHTDGNTLWRKRRMIKLGDIIKFNKPTFLYDSLGQTFTDVDSKYVCTITSSDGTNTTCTFTNADTSKTHDYLEVVIRESDNVHISTTYHTSMSGTTFQPTDRSYISLLEIFYGSKQYVDNQYINIDEENIKLTDNGALTTTHSIITGTVAPTADIGKIGDIYVQYNA